MVEPDDLIEVDLSDEERRFLIQGLFQWGGPAACTDALACAMGFDSVEDLHEQGSRMVGALRSGQSMSRFDWQRILVATEIDFISDAFGAGVDWPTVAGFGDEESLALLRGLQRRLAGQFRDAWLARRPGNP